MTTPYSKGDRATGWIVFGIIAVCAALFLAGCTLAENEKIARDNPKLAPTTQAVEKAEQVVDKAAAATAAAAGAVEQVAKAADTAGVPYAKLFELLAAGVAGIATLYTGHRMGTNTQTRAALELTSSDPPRN